MAIIKQLVWDWNGTLLNDVHMCVKVMNKLLHKYALEPLSLDTYKKIFDFPVKEYYAQLGFDFEQFPFEKVGLEFMDEYFKELPKCNLFTDAPNILESIQEMGISQLVLSAMQHDALENSITDKGIRSYFSIVQGIDNHLANGKSELANNLLIASNHSAQETLLIGDTIHDLHVAQSVGSQCALISNGHFSKERLLKEHDLVFDTLNDFIIFFKTSLQ